MTARERESHSLKHPLDLSLLQETQESFCFLPNPHCKEQDSKRNSPAAGLPMGGGSCRTPCSKHQHSILVNAAPPHAMEQRARQKVSPGAKASQPIAGGRSARTANTTAASFPLRGCQQAGSHRPQPGASQTKLPRNCGNAKDMTSGH